MQYSRKNDKISIQISIYMDLAVHMNKRYESDEYNQWGMKIILKSVLDFSWLS